MKVRLAGYSALVLAAVLSIASSRFGPAQLATSHVLSGGMCFGVGTYATLHGSPIDPRLTWASDRGSGQRFELIWPLGYRAEFNPGLQLFDSFGQQVGREGDLIVGSCVGGNPAVWSVDSHDLRPPTWQPGDG